MLLKNTLTALLVACLATAAPQQPPFSKRAVAFDWSTQKVRGVNIGGWLVLEPWITPSIFESLDQSLGIVDEFTLTQKLGTAAALNILRPHWDTWCTWADFKKIADSGFNMVRIPIGYWAYALYGEPYTQGASVYIDAAVDWARSLGLKIMIDLHGAPGSQNGFDNSGHKVAYPGWLGGDTVAQTLHVLQTISAKYAQPQYQDVIVAIELLNEPAGFELPLDQIKNFYRSGFAQVRSISDTPVVLQDAFSAPSSYNGFLTPQDNNAQNVVIDHHEYQVFTNGQIAMPNWLHVQQVCAGSGAYTGSDKWTIIGEWTGAETDCARHLNGYGVGARFDGTYPGSSYVGSCANKNNIASWDQTQRNDVRQYIEAQLDVFEARTNGWIFWNFKTEGAGEWDAFALINAGIFPQPLTARQFPAPC